MKYNRSDIHFIVILLLILHVEINAEQTDKNISVLILHSYHKADWSDSITEGIMNEIQNIRKPEIHIEYMDTKIIAIA